MEQNELLKANKQTKKSTGISFFYGQIFLWPIRHVLTMFVAKMLLAKVSKAQMFTAKLPRVPVGYKWYRETFHRGESSRKKLSISNK